MERNLSYSLLLSIRNAITELERATAKNEFKKPLARQLECSFQGVFFIMRLRSGLTSDLEQIIRLFINQNSTSAVFVTHV